jgi:hypothetical protein
VTFSPQPKHDVLFLADMGTNTQAAYQTGKIHLIISHGDVGS